MFVFPVISGLVYPLCSIGSCVEHPRLFSKHFGVGISFSNSCLDLSLRWFLNVYFYSSRFSRIAVFKQGPGRINCCKLFLDVLPF